jgi:ferredoxin
MGIQSTEDLIYCFTGTGNSLCVARWLTSTLGDACIERVAGNTQPVPSLSPYKSVGIVCPTYYSGLPPIVASFIERVDFTASDDVYVYGVVTAGGVQVHALEQMAAAVQRRGGRMRGGFSVMMPGNYILKYGAYPAWAQTLIMRRAQRRVGRIGRWVAERRMNVREASDSQQSESGRASAGALSASEFAGFAQDYRVSDVCTGCATCVQICPMHNVTIANGRPEFGASCARCFACLQWCPAGAIDYKSITQGRKRYHNPNVSRSDFMRTK